MFGTVFNVPPLPPHQTESSAPFSLWLSSEYPPLFGDEKRETSRRGGRAQRGRRQDVEVKSKRGSCQVWKRRGCPLQRRDRNGTGSRRGWCEDRNQIHFRDSGSKRKKKSLGFKGREDEPWNLCCISKAASAASLKRSSDSAATDECVALQTAKYVPWTSPS